MSHQVVKVRREALAPCMTCPLCHKLFREATTIIECLHTCDCFSSLFVLIWFRIQDFFFCRDCWLNWVEFALVRMCLCDLGFTCLDWLWWSVDLGVFVGCWLVSLFGCIFVWSCSSSTSAANFEVDGIWLILVCSWELRLSLRIDLIGILEFRIWMFGGAPFICNTWILIVDRIDLHAKFMLLTPHMV